jgi:hypothetical protein
LGKQWKEKHVVVISKTFRSDTSIEPLLEACQAKKKDFLKQNCFDVVGEGVKFLEELIGAQKLVKETYKKSIP